MTIKKNTNVEKRKQLEAIMIKYVDNDNCMDISEFRKDNPNLYGLISHYFGSIPEMLTHFGWVKVNNNGKKPTLKNQLAYEMLKELKKNNTYQEIADRFGASRAGISQLFKALEKKIEA